MEYLVGILILARFLSSIRKILYYTLEQVNQLWSIGVNHSNSNNSRLL